MPTTSSIYHFFARIALRRGYFRTIDKLSDFGFPDDMGFTGSSGGFPDLVLKTNDPKAEFPGGEMIELKDSTSYSISSFNSTLPSELKPVSILTRSLRDEMIDAGEQPDLLPERRVYYLIRGRNERAEPAPKAKVCLVSGKFFETIPVDELLPSAFRQVAQDVSNSEIEIPEEYLRLFRRKEDFASTREVEGSSVKIRFRVMADAHPAANLLRERAYPMITDDTLSLLVPEESLGALHNDQDQYSWHGCPDSIRSSQSFRNLQAAFDEIEPALKDDVALSKLQHPMNGPFFLAQFDL